MRLGEALRRAVLLPPLSLFCLRSACLVFDPHSIVVVAVTCAGMRSAGIGLRLFFSSIDFWIAELLEILL